MIPSNLSRSDCTLSKAFIFSLSSRRFLSRIRILVSYSSSFLLPPACIVATRPSWAVGDLPLRDVGFSSAALEPGAEARESGELGDCIGSSTCAPVGGSDGPFSSKSPAGELLSSLTLGWLPPPACPDLCFTAGVIETLLEGSRDNLEEDVLRGLAEPFIVVAKEGREFRGGGAMDVRGPFGGGTMEFLAVPEGVLVREELAVEAVDASGFVGDLLGDCAISALANSGQDFEVSPESPTVNLVTPAGLGAGVGLPATALLLFLAVESRTLCLRTPPGTPILDGRPLIAAPFVFPFIRVTGFGVGSSSTTTIAPGLTNMPWPGRH